MGGKATSGSSHGNGSYHLGLIHELPVDDNTSDNDDRDGGKRDLSSLRAFDFVCSSSGATTAEAEEEHGGEEGATAVDFDRVCALRGEVVQIFTFFHQRADDDTGKGKCTALCAPLCVLLESILYSGFIGVPPAL